MTTAKPAACSVGWWHAPATQGQRGVHGLWAIATWASSDTAGTWWDAAGKDMDDEALWLSAR